MGLATLAALGCTFVTESDIKGSGLGTVCTSNDQCHAGVCDNGICVASCSVDGECPSPTKCFGNKCQTPLKVAGLWIGPVTAGEGWNTTHQEGMEEAAKQLPYLSWYKRENVLPFTGDVDKAIDEAVVKEKVDVVVLNSFSQREEMMKKAEQYKDVKFLNCSGDNFNGHNAISYDGHIEQSWWVAGRVAGSKAKKRLGFVASFITPEVVRYISAFYLGARSINKDIKLEVQWLGFWVDYKTPESYAYRGPLSNNEEVKLYREDLLTYRLIDGGAEVIAHSTDSQRPVRAIERLTKAQKIHDIYSISNDNKAGCVDLTTKQPMQSCLGSPHWNWTPLYIQMFDDIHRGIWKADRNRNEVMTIDAVQSVPGFELNPASGIDSNAVRSYVTEISGRGWEYAFAGPYETTGQRDRDLDGLPDPVQAFGADEKMLEAEYNTMCWFPKGVIEKFDVTDPKSPDVDGRVPDEDRVRDAKFVNDLEGPPGVPPGVGIVCKKNL
ncbi:BMP family ABC transporter substrate-binding protein [Pendulispora rubella]|uniref:BMP family ABC transporter substrate-binding protein n=1 Tax=Pendulispora rubella TaxID=2741070 RepID=A0ABZ2KQX5_9BACT